MAENIVNLGVNTDTRRSIEAATGNQLKSSDIVRLIAGERPIIAATFLNNDLTAVAFGGSDTFEMNVDIDFTHDEYSGTLNAGYTGAVTEIAITFASDMTGLLRDAGSLTLEDTSTPGNRESIDYTAIALSGGNLIVTFTVSKTLTNSYSSGDYGAVQDRLMAQATESDVNTGEWTSASKTAGLLSFRLDCRDKEFTDKLTLAGTDLEYRLHMEIKRYPTGSTIPIVLMQDTVYGRQTVRDLEDVTIPSDENWTVADGRYQKLNIAVAQASHGLAINDVIYNNAGTWTKAKADAVGTLGVAVVSSVVDAGNFTFRASGDFASSGHGYTVGAYLYLSEATAGLLTETAPTGLTEYSQPLVYTLDANTLLVFPWRPEQALIRNLDTFITADVTGTPYAILDTDEFVPVDATAASNITNLPTPSATYAGFTVTVMKVDSSANTVTVKSASGTVGGIAGATGIVISVQYNALTLVCDGTNWEVKADRRGVTSALTTALTPITHTAPGSPDYAIQDMTSTSPFGFVTQDEANTVLSVILSLQTRVNELEAKLQSHSLIG